VSRHEVQWVTAAPLWGRIVRTPDDGQRVEAMREPAILRFHSDAFMDDLAGVLAHEPGALRGYRAQRLSYRVPPPGETEPKTLETLKLYQPAHGDFYLVTACLVCRLPGLPDREVDERADEQVAFVLRRRAEGSEWAWVADPTARKGKSWRRLNRHARRRLGHNEELHPLFPVVYDDHGRRRRLLAGLVPTSSGDSFKAAGTFSPLAAPSSSLAGAPAPDPRPEELKRILTEPVKALQEPATGSPPNQKAADALVAQKKEASRFVALDVAEFIKVNAPAAWDAIEHGRPTGSTQLDELLAQTADGTWTWRAALAKAWNDRGKIAGDEQATSALDADLTHTPVDPAALATAIVNVLTSPVPPPATGTTSASKGGVADLPTVPKLDAFGGATYVLRCVYRRPACGPLHPDVVSAPSEEFAIASFFDLDAPARSIQIQMPIDTSIKSLRQVRKNVNVLMSNELRQQLSRVTELKKILDGNLASGEGFDLGMMCSFSIPIITICALLVLMIFISLLNIVFWWMPFLRICFPIVQKGR
jgi:hypothetical protein